MAKEPPQLDAYTLTINAGMYFSKTPETTQRKQAACHAGLFSPVP